MKKTLVCLTILVVILSVIAMHLLRKTWQLDSKAFYMAFGLTGLEHIEDAEKAFAIESLAGLEPLHVRVTAAGRGVNQAVLTEEQLKAYVESKLRQAGIKILTKEESMTTVDKAFFKLIAWYSPNRGLGRDSNVCDYMLTLQSGHSVRPTRFVLKPELSDLEFDVVTWNLRKSSKCNRDVAVEAIQNTTQELVDRFLTDYHIANPKKAE